MLEVVDPWANTCCGFPNRRTKKPIKKPGKILFIMDWFELGCAFLVNVEEEKVNEYNDHNINRQKDSKKGRTLKLIHNLLTLPAKIKRKPPGLVWLRESGTMI